MKVYKIKLFNHIGVREYKDLQQAKNMVNYLAEQYGPVNVNLIEIKKSEIKWKEKDV